MLAIHSLRNNAESYFRHVFASSILHYTKNHDNVLYLVSNAFSHFIVGISVNVETETVQHGPTCRAGTSASL